MAERVLVALYLFLPAYAANMAPVIVKRLGLFPSLNRPLDGSRTLWRQPILGAHKTLRGVIVGVCAAIGVAALQRALLLRSSWLAAISSPPLEVLSPVLWGGALGLGALLGDLAKSFVKRRLGIPPGRRWFPFDQLDLIVGALVLARALYHIPWDIIVIVLVLTPLLGILVNLGGYLLSIKEAW